jgi:hypothetical protein
MAFGVSNGSIRYQAFRQNRFEVAFLELVGNFG